jgi:hypothetical protein
VQNLAAALGFAVLLSIPFLTIIETRNSNERWRAIAPTVRLRLNLLEFSLFSAINQQVETIFSNLS